MPASPATAAPWPRPLELALRLAISYGVLLWLAQRHGRSFVDALLPMFKWMIPLLDDHYRVLAISTGTEGPDTVVRLRANLAHAIVLNGNLTMPHPQGWLEVTTTIGTVLQSSLVALGLALAWPAKHAMEYVTRLTVAAVLIFCAILADTPFTLWAYLWDMHVQAYDPERFSLLLWWQKFLISGGRLGIGLCVAVVAIAIGQKLTVAGRHADQL